MHQDRYSATKIIEDAKRVVRFVDVDEGPAHPQDRPDVKAVAIRALAILEKKRDWVSEVWLRQKLKLTLYQRDNWDTIRSLMGENIDIRESSLPLLRYHTVRRIQHQDWRGGKRD